jgi:DGQHR domain-containing protein
VADSKLVRRAAIRIVQDHGRELYMFSLPAEVLSQIADVRRARRTPDGELVGYQRSVAPRHVRNIVEYLDSNDVLMPNSIVLALSRRALFRANHGSDAGSGCSGTIELPVAPLGSRKAAWIVDGQQRATALAASARRGLSVPVNAFFADERVQRDQFLRVNSVRPVPRQLVDELLPSLHARLPGALRSRRLPSILCDELNSRRRSPFRQLIRRATFVKGLGGKGVVSDGPMMRMLQNSLQRSHTALSPFISHGVDADIDRMVEVLCCFWDAARAAFPKAWGLAPSQSRLMHAAGIVAMGALMDHVMPNVDVRAPRDRDRVERRLRQMAPSCAWTERSWPKLGLEWNAVQSVASHVRDLSHLLISLYERA